MPLNPNEVQALITDAQQSGMNSKRLYEAIGIPWDEFARMHRDITFTPEQQVQIEKEINRWRYENKKIDLFTN